MAQDMFTAPCGCIWNGDQLQQACAAWQALNATRDELRQGGASSSWKSAGSRIG